MTTDYQAFVRQFHEASGQEVADKPTVGTEELRVLRCRLLLEEVLEFIEAAGVRIQAYHIASKDGAGLRLEPHPTNDPDYVKMAHELADIHYVTAGANAAFGFPGDKVFAEVHAANMRKFPEGKVVRRADGKILKPEGLEEAAQYLERVFDQPTMAGEIRRLKTR